MVILANKALEVLARKFATADRTKRRLEQIRILEQMATVGRSTRNLGYTTWSAELHGDMMKLAGQQSHIEFGDNVQGQLVPNKGNGVMAHVKDSDGDGICNWGQAGSTSTLDQAINHAPEGFGGQIAGQSLNMPQLMTLIMEILS